MGKSPLITMVVPIYNVDRFLAVCIESILAQSYKNLEIILVDAGSTDSCGRICDEYEKKDARIRVIHQVNKGLSEARNAGIDAASGAYIAFIDSDDYIDRNYVETLFGALVENDAEIAVCSFRYVSEEEDYVRNSTVLPKKKIFTGQQFLLAEKQLRDLSVIVWNKLYKRSVFSKLRYKAGVLYEDAYIYPKLFWERRKVVVTSEILYSYRKRQGSITNSLWNFEKAEAHYGIYKERQQFYREKGNSYLYETALQGLCRSITNFYAYDETKKVIPCERHRKLQREIRENGRMLRWSKNITLKDRIHNAVAFMDVRLAGMIKKYRRICRHEIGKIWKLRS